MIISMHDGTTLDETTAKKAVKKAGVSLRKLEPVRPVPQGAAERPTP